MSISCSYPKVLGKWLVQLQLLQSYGNHVPELFFSFWAVYIFMQKIFNQHNLIHRIIPVLCKTSCHASVILWNRMTGFKIPIGNDSWPVVAAELWLSTPGDQVLVDVNQNYTEGHADSLVVQIFTCQKLGMCYAPAQFAAIDSALLSTQKAFNIFQ